MEVWDLILEIIVIFLGWLRYPIHKRREKLHHSRCLVCFLSVLVWIPPSATNILHWYLVIYFDIFQYYILLLWFALFLYISVTSDDAVDVAYRALPGKMPHFNLLTNENLCYKKMKWNVTIAIVDKTVHNIKTTMIMHCKIAWFQTKFWSNVRVIVKRISLS